MPQDRKAIAEARALQACIQVTTDSVEQNRLWNRYYKLSDEVFPEAAVLHQRYKTLEGAERQRFKTEYMELVRRLWAATDPQAAYPVSFSETPAVAPMPRYPTPERPARALPPKPRQSFKPLFAVLALAAMIAGALTLWQYGESKRPEVERSVAVLPGPEAEPEKEAASIPATVPASPPQVAQEPASPALGPPPEFNPPMEKIEAEVAQAVPVIFVEIPAALQGKGDRISYPGGEFVDSYIIESDSLYYVRVPERGVVESIAKEGAHATISQDTASRDALLAIWKQNREEIDRVNSVREKEKASRLAAYRKAYETQLAQHKESAAAESWRTRAADWLALGADQRNVLRARAYSNWQAIQQKVERVRELYEMISRAYAAIGISDERVGRLSASYNEASRSRGPDYAVEDALIEYGWKRDDWIREVVVWEKEYYQLSEYLQKNYPEIEKRVDEIKRLDDTLPAEVRATETAVNWDAATEPVAPPEEAGGVGTGFVVSKGIVMTCAHVVQHGSQITVTFGNGKALAAKVHTIDAGNDWALLEVPNLETPPIPVSVEKPNVGATIYCIGFPLGGIKDSADPIVGSGNIAALQRLDGDNRFMQITAPVNPGNSGGPVLDQYGRWVGIVSQKLNDMATLRAAETVTQGVNFALKASFIQPLMQPQGGVTLTPVPATGQPLGLEEIVKRCTGSIVKIEVR